MPSRRVASASSYSTYVEERPERDYKLLQRFSGPILL